MRAGWPAAALALGVLAEPAAAAPTDLVPFRSCGELVRSIGGARAAQAPLQAGPHSAPNVAGNGADAAVTGTTLFALDGPNLRVVDISQDQPRSLARMRIPGGYASGFHHLVVAPGRLLVVADTGGSTGVFSAAKVLSEIDVTNPARPRLLRTLTFNGDISGVALHGTTVRVVSGRPIYAFKRGSRLERYLGRLTLTERATGRRTRSLLAPCTQVRHDAKRARHTPPAIRPFPLARGGLRRVDRDVFMGSPVSNGIVFSAGATYVPTYRSALHRYRRDGARSSYRGSVALPGEYAGVGEDGSVLHVVTSARADMHLTNVAIRERRLERLGSTALGVGNGYLHYAQSFDGDRVYAIGRTAQGATLAIAQAGRGAGPAVAARVTLPRGDGYGMSAPLADGLLAVQPPANSDVLLYDVRDPAAPQLLASRPLAANSFAAVVGPVALLNEGAARRVLRLDRATPLADAGTIAHPDNQLPRGIVVGEHLVTVTPGAVAITRLSDMQRLGIATFS